MHLPTIFSLLFFFLFQTASAGLCHYKKLSSIRGSGTIQRFSIDQLSSDSYNYGFSAWIKLKLVAGMVDARFLTIKVGEEGSETDIFSLSFGYSTSFDIHINDQVSFINTNILSSSWIWLGIFIDNETTANKNQCKFRMFYRYYQNDGGDDSGNEFNNIGSEEFQAESSCSYFIPAGDQKLTIETSDPNQVKTVEDYYELVFYYDSVVVDTNEAYRMAFGPNCIISIGF